MRGRRLLPALFLLAGAAALLLGLVALERIFLRERAAALAGLDARKRALEQYARQALADELARRLEAVEAQIALARHDPLVATSGLLLLEDGRQTLPRRIAMRTDATTPARALHEALRAGAGPSGEAETPFAERLALYRRLSGALARKDRGGIEESFREFLRHRMLYVLPAARDLPLATAAIELLAERSLPRAELLRGLLRDGLADGRGGRMEGLQRALLGRRERLSEGDFRYLAERVRLLSATAGVVHDDFVVRAGETVGEKVEVPGDLREPALLGGGRWYAEPRPDGSVHGVAVSLEPLLGEVAGGMRQRGLVGADARVRLDAAAALPLSRAVVGIEAPAFAREAAETARNQRVKAAWGILCGLLAVLLVTLGALWMRQERRYVDLKADFVATVSHELRTPLASVRLLGETLERRLGAEGRDYPARIVREVDRLSFLVENILSFNRISRGKVRPHLSDVNLGELAEGVHRDRGEGRDVELSLDGLSDAWLKGDPELLQLLFSNLYENAWRYATRRPVRIALRTEAREGALEILFSDNGDGIPAGEEERVFQDFHRAASPAGGARRGSGLGLAICRRIMALHGGAIRLVKSGAEGTTFGMSFPRT